MTGARYQIAVDGQPRSNRGDRAIAIEAAEYLKTRSRKASADNALGVSQTPEPIRRAASLACVGSPA